MDSRIRLAFAGGLLLTLAACGTAPGSPVEPSVSVAPATTVPDPTTTTTPPPVTTTTVEPPPAPAEPPPAPPAPKPPTPKPPAPKPVPPPKPPAPKQNCDASYPGVCIAPAPPDLDCPDVPYKNFQVRQPDPHRFDADHDGIGCET
ncbi:MAG TPA: hypothetical protein VFV67_33135 [Actinophytocola sp.]|uniref:hypothetical protein n=1 Tax=Actinophytocola sp. TaxID=1872138 RepID=UPI002DBE1A96|nr:hypothetical protein [Actinophytocola sp.]HEU5475513.1 hypothetical protein [Actinophytocola sp.]